MNFKRTSAVFAVAGTVVLAMSGCGSDNNTSASTVDTSKSTALCDGKARLNAAGSSAQGVAMDQFAAVYKQVCQGKGKNDVEVAYQPNGSGDGRNKFVSNLIDFAGSDSAMTGDQLKQAAARCNNNPAWNIPLVFGPIAVAYNLDGVKDLVLTPELLAQIFSGKLTKWDDPAIAKANPNVKLPSEPIAVIFRSDSSGTTDNFQKYLAAAAPGAWDPKAVGSDFKGNTGQGQKGSPGIAQGVSSTPGSIGYIEDAFAIQSKLATAAIDGGAGPVQPTAQAATLAVANAKQQNPDSMDLTLDLGPVYTTKTAGAYPLVLATYEIVCSKGYDAGTAKAVKSFLTSASNEGQTGLDTKGYVPLAAPWNTKVAATIAAIG